MSLRPDDPRYDVNSGVDGLWKKERRAHHSWLVTAAYQWNFPFDTFGGALDTAVRPIYGMNRFRVTAGFEKHWIEKGKTLGPGESRPWTRLKENAFKARLWGEVTDKSKDVANCSPEGPQSIFRCAPRASWGADFTAGLFSKADGLGFYLRLMQAQDYYNLSFFRRKETSFQAGLSFSLSRGRGQSFPVIEAAILEEESRDKEAWKANRGKVKNEATKIRKAAASVKR